MHDTPTHLFRYLYLRTVGLGKTGRYSSAATLFPVAMDAEMASRRDREFYLASVSMLKYNNRLGVPQPAAFDKGLFKYLVSNEMISERFSTEEQH